LSVSSALHEQQFRARFHRIVLARIERRLLPAAPPWSWRAIRTETKLYRSATLDESQIRDVYTELVALEGDRHLERIRWLDSGTGVFETHEIRHVFMMTGAVPNTGWLAGCVALDGRGFIKTGPDLSPEDLTTGGWALARSPYLLETNRPGVFAVGDVRSGNIKRVASAVGEGSIAVAFVHQVLHQ